LTAEIAHKLRQRWRRRVTNLSACDRLWRYSRRPRPDDPSQGWKIHLSATLLSANEVLSRVWPVLVRHDAYFKVAAHFDSLTQLNAGLTDFSQVGKFLTVYPRSTDEAVNLARELHAATRGLSGPQIPFDLRYRKNSLVYYRYGCFRATSKDGAGPGLITDSRGKSHVDKRAAGCAVPRWLDDPFTKPHSRVEHPPYGGPLAPDYLPFRAISQRGKGGVYEAVDLSVSPARRVIIKEGRRHGETTWDGEDGYARVKREGLVLRALRRAGIPAPQVFRELNRDGNRYLVLEKIMARSLIGRKNMQPAKHSWRRALRLLEQLGAALAQIHQAGWVWRDCKPSHIYPQHGAIRLIDFEGACRIGDRNVLPWGSPNYVPACCRGGFHRRAGTWEDDYALGVIAFQFMAGEFPPRSARRRRALFQRSGCPDFLRAQLENLLRC
jgi:hypothetical protein